MSLETPEVVRFGALTIADHEQSDPWLAERRTPTRAGWSTPHQLLSLFNRSRHDETVEPVEDWDRSVRAAEISPCEIMLISRLEVGEWI
jgi:hypothetical protein